MDSSDSDSSIATDALDVILQFGNTDFMETELIPSLSCAAWIEHSALSMRDVVNHLQSLGYPLYNTTVWYYSPNSKGNVYCGEVPLGANVKIALCELQDDTLYLICRDYVGAKATIPARPIPVKEPSIEKVVAAVSQWRVLCIEEFKSDPVQAAEKVGFSLRVLQDYATQLSEGVHFGFNFEAHRTEQLDLLREFNWKSRTWTHSSNTATPACRYPGCCKSINYI